MLAPESVKIPAPCLVRPPVPLITPEKVVLVASPVVRMAVPSVTLPAPAREPIVSAKLFRLKVAPCYGHRIGVCDPIGGPQVSVPALMVVAPV